jgi:hypothetical protein
VVWSKPSTKHSKHAMDEHMKNPLFKEIPFEKEIYSKGEKKI